MLLTKHILPTFASMTLEDMTPTAVATWYADTATHTPVTRIHAYARLRAIMEDALARNLIEVSPCQEVDVSTSRRAEAVCPATAEEVDAIAAAMPARYQALVLMAAWLAMPFSELGELRRKDVDLDANLVRVRGPYAAAPQGHSQRKCRPHEHGTDPHQHPAGRNRVTRGTVLRRPRYPAAVDALHQLTDHRLTICRADCRASGGQNGAVQAAPRVRRWRSADWMGSLLLAVVTVEAGQQSAAARVRVVRWHSR